MEKNTTKTSDETYTSTLPSFVMQMWADALVEAKRDAAANPAAPADRPEDMSEDVSESN